MEQRLRHPFTLSDHERLAPYIPPSLRDSVHSELYCSQFLHSDAAGKRGKDGESTAHEEESDKDSQELTYKTFLGHLYDLVEDKINSERYDEGVRQLVGNQVRA